MGRDKVMRFYAGSTATSTPKDGAALAKALRDMGGDYIQASARDGVHVLFAMGYAKDRVLSGCFSATGAAERSARVVRAIDQGRGKDFTRSPDEPTDDGQDEFEVKGLAAAIGGLAAGAKAAGKKVSIVVFDPAVLTAGG